MEFFSGIIFNDSNTGLKRVLYSNCRQLQTKNIVAQEHNVLSDDDVVKLNISDYLSLDHQQGFILCVILNIALATTWSPEMLRKLIMHQVSKTAVRGRCVIMLRSVFAPKGVFRTVRGVSVLVTTSRWK